MKGMKKITVGFLMFFMTCGTAWSQPNKTYTSFEQALECPENVYILQIRYSGLSKIPESIGRFHNLVKLEYSSYNYYMY